MTTTPTPAPVNATPSTAPATPPGETSSAPVSPTPLERLYPLPRLSGPEFGIQAFLWWHTDNKTGWRDADLVRDLGFGWLKQQFSWTNINPFRGTYDWSRADGVLQLAQARGLKLLVRIDHEPEWARDGAESGTPVNLADFGEFCGVLAARYVGRIAAYEVWNEPNLSREWGGQAPDPAGYVEMLKTCYLAIKSTDPNAIVISAGLAPTDQDDAVAMPDMKYYRAAYAAGAAQYSDMLGVHAPGYGSPPERAPSEAEADSFWQSRVWVFRHAEDVRAMMVAAGDGDKQIAITEMGWTSDPIHPDYSWYAVDEATRAEYLVHAYQYARAHWQPWIAIMSMVYIVDPDWTEADEQYWWSITRPTLPGDPPILLPAYEALRDMAK